MEIAVDILTCRVAPRDSSLLEIVEVIACAAGRPIRPLHLQSLLQLPRISDERGFVSILDVQKIVYRVALELPCISDWLAPAGLSSPLKLRFGVVGDEIAREITDKFHYLRSARRDGRSYGLWEPGGKLVALCVVSPLDVLGIVSLLRREGRCGSRAGVVSRVFAFEGAPRNSISHLLAQVVREEKRGGVTDLVTYVNPNMGFSGASYKASGWSLLGFEPGTAYQYLDERYITARRLEELFGPQDNDSYRRLLGRRFSVSRMPLDPLLIFHTPIR
jgi:hypothetical protein